MKSKFDEPLMLKSVGTSTPSRRSESCRRMNSSCVTSPPAMRWLPPCPPKSLAPLLRYHEATTRDVKVGDGVHAHVRPTTSLFDLSTRLMLSGRSRVVPLWNSVLSREVIPFSTNRCPGAGITAMRAWMSPKLGRATSPSTAPVAFAMGPAMRS